MHDAFAGPGRFYKGNLHTHSTRSDAVCNPAAVCELYREAGYDFISLTDHFLPRYGYPITDTQPFRTNSFTTILGAEVHAPATELGEMWHILSVGLPLDFAPPTPEERGPDLARRSAEAGAFVVIAHPSWYGLTIADAETIPSAHAVEIFNTASAVEADRGDSWPFLDTLLARGHRLNACAVDDAHFKNNDWFGGWVMVKSDSPEPDSLVAALKAGHYYSSQGPEIHALAIDGDEIAIECSPASWIRLLGRGSPIAFAKGDQLRSARLPLAELKPGGYARVVITDAEGHRAWSNPLWLDAA